MKALRVLDRDNKWTRKGDSKLINKDVFDVKPIGQYAYGRFVLIGEVEG